MTISILIRYGANLNHQNEEGQTPLIYSIINKNLHMTNKLLEHNTQSLYMRYLS